jgi:hypothetical protein
MVRQNNNTPITLTSSLAKKLNRLIVLRVHRVVVEPEMSICIYRTYISQNLVHQKHRAIVLQQLY